jgi:hypothetical protein
MREAFHGKTTFTRRRVMQHKSGTPVVIVRIGIVFAAVILLATFTSCSLFRAKTEPDLQPFAEQTITMAGKVNQGFAEVRSVYIRREASDIQEVEELREMVATIRLFMGAIVEYSLQVVTLSQSSKTGPERAQAFADFLDELLDPVVEQKDVELHYAEGNLKEILENIREQETLIDALRIGQPIVDEAAYVAGAYLDRFKDKQTLAAQRISDAIDEEFYAIISYTNILREQEEITLEVHERLAEYALGDKTALDKIEYEKLLAFQDINVEDGLDFDELYKIEERILTRMDKISKLRNDMEPELEKYRIKQRELDKITREIDKSLMDTRATIYIWNKTHLKMSEGLTKPAAISLFNITQQLMDSAIQEIPEIPVDMPF